MFACFVVAFELERRLLAHCVISALTYALICCSVRAKVLVMLAVNASTVMQARRFFWVFFARCVMDIP